MEADIVTGVGWGAGVLQGTGAPGHEPRLLGCSVESPAPAEFMLPEVTLLGAGAGAGAEAAATGTLVMGVALLGVGTLAEAAGATGLGGARAGAAAAAEAMVAGVAWLGVDTLSGAASVNGRGEAGAGACCVSRGAAAVHMNIHTPAAKITACEGQGTDTATRWKCHGFGCRTWVGVFRLSIPPN